MTTNSKILLLIGAIWLATQAISCANNPQFGVIDPPDRRWVEMNLGYGANQGAPLAVAIQACVHMKYYEANSKSIWLIKVELDFGDSPGWLDFSPQFLAVHTLSAGTITQGIDHTYAQPGTYTIKMRATYLDGEIVTTRMDTAPALATVTVPSGS